MPWVLATVALLGVGLLLLRPGFLRVKPGMEIGGERLVWNPYRHPQRINEGYAQEASDGVRKGWLLFNVHGTVAEPLRTGDRFEIDLQKDVWRGHAGVYLSDRPFAECRDPREFGHRERFGGLDHLLWFHLDGDSVVAPTARVGGQDLTLDPADWDLRVRTNTLAPYHLELRVDADRFRWTIATGPTVLATGSHPRRPELRFLGLYLFDNTLCYLTGLRRFRPPDGRL